ncbi:hypothetical protein GA0115254_110656 [Streptomyces sp. Ncost-T10-10d]|nr:hypothetical protein GA0115254_110656 [Streptomyces sp. Ncost-T10-10d]
MPALARINDQGGGVWPGAVYDSVWGSASTQVKFDEILKKAEREAPYAYTDDGRDGFPAIPDSWNRCASG